jgi:hypothetical protein
LREGTELVANKVDKVHESASIGGGHSETADLKFFGQCGVLNEGGETCAVEAGEVEEEGFAG